MNIICIIPARGGSKGIPRKNLRPLAGKPMIYYAINAALNSKMINKVVVTTDDDEIALFSRRFGAETIMRPESLGQDSVTLDPVIVHAVEKSESDFNESYDFIMTVQPTSPLIRSSDLDESLKLFEEKEFDTVLSVVDDRHLCWSLDNKQPVPLYTERVNRQQLPANYRETGAIISCRRSQLSQNTRIGLNVGLYIMPQERSFDIDTLSDFYLCEAILKHKKIVFTVVGRNELGMGHAYRAVMIAHELVKYDIHFICEEQDQLAIDYISKHNYMVSRCPNNTLLEHVLKLQPDMVINDILDTDDHYICSLKQNGIKVVNFEDMGTGYEKADLVVNALYPHQIPSDHTLIGAKYFCLRDEFLHGATKSTSNTVKKILITFGGTDETNLTAMILILLKEYCKNYNINIDVIVGPGYLHNKELSELISSSSPEHINYVTSTTKISDYMSQADLAITSGGRTVLELASLQVPTIVICQNQRETTHTFASSENGILNLGYQETRDKNTIIKSILQVIENSALRKTMREKMSLLNLTEGKKRVISKIIEVMEQA